MSTPKYDPKTRLTTHNCVGNCPIHSQAKSDTTRLKKEIEQGKKEIAVHTSQMDKAGPQEKKYRTEAREKAANKVSAQYDSLTAARKQRPKNDRPK